MIENDVKIGNLGNIKTQVIENDDKKLVNNLNLVDEKKLAVAINLVNGKNHINGIKLDNEDIEFLDYSFTKKEVFLLAKFLRLKEEELPLGLETLYETLETSVYNTLSISEIRQFYS